MIQRRSIERRSRTTGRREDLLRTEAEGWDRLERAVTGLDDEQLARPGYTDEGWSIRDLWWHLAAWCEDTVRVLRQIRAGTWDGDDPSTQPGWTDRVNAEWFEASRSMGVPEVRAALVEGRRHLLEAFGELEELTPEADDWFDETGPTHYASHADDLDRWAGRLRDERTQMPGSAPTAP